MRFLSIRTHRLPAEVHESTETLLPGSTRTARLFSGSVRTVFIHLVTTPTSITMTAVCRCLLVVVRTGHSISITLVIAVANCGNMQCFFVPASVMETLLGSVSSVVADGSLFCVSGSPRPPSLPWPGPCSTCAAVKDSCSVSVYRNCRIKHVQFSAMI